jgi:putative lipase involved disintegration of autophagic bodies
MMYQEKQVSRYFGVDQECVEEENRRISDYYSPSLAHIQTIDGMTIEDLIDIVEG